MIDRVRVDEANRLKHDRPQRRVVKRARWLLLRNRENLSAEHQIKLHELLEANQTLMTVYVLKSVLKELWQPMTAWQWRRAWRTWLAQAHASGIEPLNWLRTGAASSRVYAGRCTPVSSKASTIASRS